MTKERYAELRKDQKFLFLYYLEEGGFLREEQGFRNMLGVWFRRGGMEWRTGVTVVTKHLDSKYQYSDR